MRKISPKLLAVLLALALLAGCGGEAEVLSSSKAPEASGPEAAGPVGDEELARLDELALLYEKSGGSAFSEGTALDADSWFAFDILYTHHLLDPYWSEEYQCWNIPGAVFERVNQYFFQKLTYYYQNDEQSTIPCSGDAGERALGFSLLREDARRLDDGSIEVTYRRVRDELLLTPVTYRFRPYTLEALPDILEGIYQQGETLYLIASVAQRPELLPETQPQTIEIGTPEELLAAARRINEGRYESRRDTYLLTADIDLAGVEWTPMGLNNRVLEFAPDFETERDPNVWGFNGTFDGQGHTIYNLTITEEQGAALLAREEQNFPDRNLGGAGFFYRIGAEGVVKNLRMENASVLVPVDGEENYSSAAILAVSCMGRLENVSVQGQVRGVQETGGLVGTLGGMLDIVYYLDGTFETTAVAENCSADVEVSGYSSIGGLAGSLHYGILRNCTANGTVTAIYAGRSARDDGMPAGIGGLVGHSVQGDAYDCGASAHVYTRLPSRWVGGFGGYWQGNSVVSCWVDGQKTGGWEPVGFFYQMNPETPEVEVR